MDDGMGVGEGTWQCVPKNFLGCANHVMYMYIPLCRKSLDG